MKCTRHQFEDLAELDCSQDEAGAFLSALSKEEFITMLWGLDLLSYGEDLVIKEAIKRIEQTT